MGKYDDKKRKGKPDCDPGKDRDKYPDGGYGYDSGAFVLFLILILLVLGSFGYGGFYATEEY